MQHIFYNVGHAETIFIQPDPKTLIVRDFGKNKKANRFRFAFSLISRIRYFLFPG